MKLTNEEQLRIMRGQLSNFDSLIEKLAYMSMAFDPDPNFYKNNRDIIRSEIAKDLKK